MLSWKDWDDAVRVGVPLWKAAHEAERAARVADNEAVRTADHQWVAETEGWQAEWTRERAQDSEDDSR